MTLAAGIPLIVAAAATVVAGPLQTTGWFRSRARVRSRPVQLTDASFDLRLAPFARGFFTGDYERLSSIGAAFSPFFAQPHDGDRSSTFFTTTD